MKIVKADQYCQKILWPNYYQTVEPTVYKMTQFVKKIVIVLSLHTEFPKAVEAIVSRHYDDEVLCRFD